ncbi:MULTISPECIES: hypothetical protein [unclassified Streptomyces]|uniref:hypothetical protein n=1 Tax=unclassified Streptomyces TaxID=2593676 RepID=UPI000F4F10CC|nr:MULTISPECIES: hypothetical protein [unclassified Streptomyces]MDH6454928.1 hypothetical protein [Streptomyces sp. SAI-119]MDH6494518.1 hypothetical protein [Streptomyces sp. SAI-149]QUC58337.1 hypothetical protein IOD14_16825 [Streptomyces sp. A2-16]
MGIYLVSVGAQEWFDTEDEGGRGALAAALGAELSRRGLPPYESVPQAPERLVRGAGLSFEEKLVPPMDGFDALCRAQLSQQEYELLCGWSLLVPFALDEEIWLPTETSYADTTMVAGAPQVLALAERLASAVDLPVDEIPAACDNLDLTMWFLDGEAQRFAAARPGPWAEDLDAAFYVALYLRAAQHSLRRGCPLVYS